MTIDYLEPEDDGIHGVGKLLSPSEVLEKLKGEFRFVKVDKVSGETYIKGRIGYLEKLKASGKNPFGVPMDDEIDRLKSVIHQTVYITFYDNTPPGDAYLATYLYPNRPNLMFTYKSPEHYEAAQPLLHRCAMALKYDVREGG